MTLTLEPFGRQFPSVELVLRAALEPATGVHVATETPPEFDDDTSALAHLPLIVVDKVSGADYVPLLDRPVVDIDAFGRDRGEAQALAERIRYVIRVQLPGQIVDGVVITASRTAVGPRFVRHANRNVRRYVGSYELSLHPQ